MFTRMIYNSSLQYICGVGYLLALKHYYLKLMLLLYYLLNRYGLNYDMHPTYSDIGKEEAHLSY